MLTWTKVVAGHYTSKCGRAVVKKQVSPQSRGADIVSWSTEVDGAQVGWDSDTKRDACDKAEKHVEANVVTPVVVEGEQAIVSHPFVATPNNGPCSSCGRLRSDRAHRWGDEQGSDPTPVPTIPSTAGASSSSVPVVVSASRGGQHGPKPHQFIPTLVGRPHSCGVCGLPASAPVHDKLQQGGQHGPSPLDGTEAEKRYCKASSLNYGEHNWFPCTANGVFTEKDPEYCPKHGQHIPCFLCPPKVKHVSDYWRCNACDMIEKQPTRPTPGGNRSVAEKKALEAELGALADQAIRGVITPAQHDERHAQAIFDAMPKTDVIPVSTAQVYTKEQQENKCRGCGTRTGYPLPRACGICGKPIEPEAKPSVLSGLANRPKDTSPHLIVEARAGCLAADTILNVNRAGKGFECTIERLVKQLTGTPPTYVRSDNGATARCRPWDLDIPTRVARAVGSVVMLGTVKQAWFSGDKETFTVTTSSGRSIRATVIHPFLCADGTWKKLGQLVVGDVVQVNGGRKSEGLGQKRQYQSLDTLYHPRQVHKGSGRHGVALHRLVIESTWNDLPFYDYMYYLRNDERRSSEFKYLNTEQIVHHLNEDPEDNRVSNLEVLDSVKEHSDRHNWGNNVLFQVGVEVITSIESFGVEPTYDIEMENEPHNFMANGFVVHNTGKTTTLIEGLKRIKGCPTEGFVPSPQQAAVFAAMEQSKGLASSIMFVAFNKSIADELKQRVPAGCEASTMHGLGFGAVMDAFRGQLTPGNEVNADRAKNIILTFLGIGLKPTPPAEDAPSEEHEAYKAETTRWFTARQLKAQVIQATDKLVGLCKGNLVDGRFGVAGMLTEEGQTEEWFNELTRICQHYDVEIEDKNRAEVFALVPRVLERCKDVEADKCLNFDDMIWLPVVLNLSIPKYDVLLVDEAQDLNRCQQELAKRAGRRLILCGDPKQAIYGFAGADSESMSRMLKELLGWRECIPGRHHESTEWKQDCSVCSYCGLKFPAEPRCIVLPLTVTRRCGKAIVREAQKFVPDFSAFESNPEGTVTYSRMESKDEVVPADRIYRSLVQDGDMVLCRVNAPLVRECFRFLKAGRKANIQGRDIGQGLISTVTKMKCSTVLELEPKLQEWLTHETAKELAKKNPSEDRIIALEDRHDCLLCFTDGLRTVGEVVRKIESVFTDDKSVKGIRLSSVHKAKGLEAENVFLLQGKGCCGGSGKKDKPRKPWENEQENNLRYVAITRAISSLTFVS